MILVVNADGAGVDPARDLGILRAAREGIVRSASVLAALPAAADLVAAARDVPALGLGLHINLTEGMPLVGGHRSLVEAGGRFAGKRELWRRAVAGLIDERECAREIEAQWARLESLGVRPLHLNGRHHVHFFPGVAEAVLRVAPPGTWVRRAKGLPPAVSLPSDVYAAPGVLAGAIAALDRRIEWPRLRSADRFAGLELPPGYSPGDLIRLLRAIGSEDAEVVELLALSGENPEGSGPASVSADREREVEALTCECIHAFVETQEIRLSSFAGVP